MNICEKLTIILGKTGEVSQETKSHNKLEKMGYRPGERKGVTQHMSLMDTAKTLACSWSALR